MNVENDLKETKISSRRVYDGVLLKVFRDEVELPDGKTSVREIIRHPGAVCIVPLMEDGTVIVEKQFRYATEKVHVELPAGKLNFIGEDRLEAAKRELREETGYTADSWTDLGGFYPAPAYSDEFIELFLASGLHKGEREPDEDEFITVTAEPLSDLVDQVMRGEIENVITQAGILRAGLMTLSFENGAGFFAAGYCSNTQFCSMIASLESVDPAASKQASPQKEKRKFYYGKSKDRLG